MEPFFSPTTSLTIVLWVFVIATAVFHGLFLYLCQLEKRGWRIADYFWLAATAFGLLGAVGQARQANANEQMDMWRDDASRAFESMRSFAKDYSAGTAFCQPGPRTRFSPPQDEFDTINREFAKTCGWFKDVSARLEPLQPQTLSEQMFLQEPVTSLDYLRRIQSDFWKQVLWSNQAMGKFLTVSAASRRSASEIDFVILSPFLLAVALALRITKVTGELRLDRAAPTAKNDIVDEQPWPVGEPESNLKPAEDQPHSPGSGMIGDVVEARTPPPEG